MARSPPNLHTMVSRWTCIQGVLKVKVKGYVIRALSWILGMSYSVMDGLVLLSRPRGLSSTTMPRPLLVPCVGWNDVMVMGHGSDDPFPSLEWSLRLGTVNGVYQCKHVLVTDMLLCQYRQWRHCSSMIVHFSLTVLATSTPPCCSPTGRNFAHCSKMSASHLRFVIAMLQPCRIGR